MFGCFGKDCDAYFDTKRDCNYDLAIFREAKNGGTKMTNNNISNLESLNDVELDDIIEQIENIKKSRRKIEYHRAVDELNELLGQISNILKRAKYIDSCELGECEFLIDNTFIVREWSDEEPCIDLERC